MHIMASIQRSTQILLHVIMLLMHFLQLLAIRLKEKVSVQHRNVLHLIIQFIIMSEDKFKRVVDKYIRKYDMTKEDFASFVQSKVDLSKKRCSRFLVIVNQILDENQFDQSKLKHLLHLLSAFQAQQNIRQIDQESLKKFTKIKFKDNLKSNTNIQKTQYQNQTLSQKTKNSEKQNENQIVKNSIDKVETNNYQKDQKQIKITVEAISDQDQAAQIKKHYKQQQSKKIQNKKAINPATQLLNKRIKEQEQEKKMKQQRRRQFQLKLEEQRKLEQSKKQKQIEQEKSKGKRQIQKYGKKLSSQSNQSDKNNKQVQRLNTIEQQRTQEINMNARSSNSHTNQLEMMMKGNKQQKQQLEIIECGASKQLIDIARYQKTGQDFMNPVIKYQILYRDKFVTWRRYSEIQKLLAYLRFKYEGIVLPQMPPKEGIKGNLGYFWRSGVNQHFLEERKEKLKQVLNRVLACQFICNDQILRKFLEDDEFELSNFGNNQNSYVQTLVGLKDIVFNYNQLKDYGMAYYNYISDSKKNVNTECSQEFQKVQNLITTIFTLNDHRLAINSNFQKRRQIMYDSKIKTKGPTKTNFDKLLEEAQIQCQQLNQQYGRYLQLKSTEGWENELIKQKSSQGRAVDKLIEDHNKTIERIGNSQKNLLLSIKKFDQRNKKIIQNIGKQLMEWRSKAHP